MFIYIYIPEYHKSHGMFVFIADNQPTHGEVGAVQETSEDFADGRSAVQGSRVRPRGSSLVDGLYRYNHRITITIV